MIFPLFSTMVMFNTTDLSSENIFGIPGLAVYAFVFIVGACIGSFLNVVIYRLPNEKSLITGSACPQCGKPIKFYHNIPILGWLLIRGKCSSCGEAISFRYPAVELLTAILFVLATWRLGFTPWLPVALVFISAMIALVFIDADHMILPNRITYPLFVFALIVRVVFPLVFDESYFPDMVSVPTVQLFGYPPWIMSLGSALFGALIGGGSLWLVGFLWKLLRGVDAMGLGDVKMMLGVGALLGWRLSVLTIFIGAFTGAVAGAVLLSRQKEKDLQTQIPFGIFLGIGSIVALLFGHQLIAWYLERFIS